MSSAEWDETGERLFVVDPAAEVIYGYPAVSSEAGGEIEIRRRGHPFQVHVSVLRQFGQGYLLEVEDGELWVVDQGFEVVAEIDLLLESMQPTQEIRGVY